MMSFLKNHPFAVEAFFDYSLVLTFAVPKEQLEGLLPKCLQLDTFDDQWGFVAMAMVQTWGLRPKGLPRLLGSNFFLIGYRIFVRYTNQAGKRLRGLYILKSETDSRRMEWLGNLFTHYNYTSTDIKKSQQKGVLKINSIKSGVEVEVMQLEGEVPLPAGSPFESWQQARRFAGPLPFTFTYNPTTKQVLIIEGVRENWKPQAVQVLKYRSAFLDSLKLNGAVLANAFIISEIPYYWKKGKLETWNG